MKQRRVYRADPDDSRAAPHTGRAYRELVGGPLDGLLIDITALSAAEIANGLDLATDDGTYGPGGCSEYGPRATDPQWWDWRGDRR